MTLSDLAWPLLIVFLVVAFKVAIRHRKKIVS